jgi:hypothetical protein
MDHPAAVSVSRIPRVSFAGSRPPAHPAPASSSTSPHGSETRRPAIRPLLTAGGHGCQKAQDRAASIESPDSVHSMAFVNEVVSDEDIDRYGLPFPKGGGRYWTRDRERDAFLWGGQTGNPAFGEDLVWIFDFLYHGQIYAVSIDRGQSSRRFSEIPFIIQWDSILSIKPDISSGEERGCFVAILKEALRVYGRDGGENNYTPSIVVRFTF